MASDIDIANLALTKLGDVRIASFDDNVKPAREILAVYDLLRDKLQRRYVWRFCVSRENLAADVETPAFDFTSQYTLPSDCLRVLMAGDYYPRITLSDANGSPGQDYRVEGRKILARDSGALPILYLKRITDPTMFDAAFIDAFAAFLAYNLAEPLTQSNTKRDAALLDFNLAIRDAVRANAIENPPEELQDDTWVVARL